MSNDGQDWLNKAASGILPRLLQAAAFLKFGTRGECSCRPGNKIREATGSHEVSASSPASGHSQESVSKFNMKIYGGF